MKLATYDEDGLSYQRQDQKVHFAARLESSTGGARTTMPIVVDDAALAACGVKPVPEKGVLPALALFAVDKAIDVAFDAIQDYVDRKVGEFEQTYSASLNVDAFDIRNGANDCLFLSRTVTLGEGTGKKPGTVALSVVIKLDPVDIAGAPAGNQQVAFTARPIYLDLAYPAARTSEKAKAVDLEVALAIRSLELKGGRYAPGQILSHSFSFSGVKRTTAEGARPWTLADKFAGEAFESPIFVIDRNGLPASLAVGVTERGPGAKQFAKAKDESKAELAAIKEVAGGFFKEKLGGE